MTEFSLSERSRILPENRLHFREYHRSGQPLPRTPALNQTGKGARLSTAPDDTGTQWVVLVRPNGPNGVT